SFPRAVRCSRMIAPSERVRALPGSSARRRSQRGRLRKLGSCRGRDPHLPPGRRVVSLFGSLRSAGSLPVEGHLPGFDGATGWLNSAPLTDADLEGKVVLADFWTYTCINWLRTLAYVRAWADRYAEHGLVLVGVHTPEFPFERDVD